MQAAGDEPVETAGRRAYNSIVLPGEHFSSHSVAVCLGRTAGHNPNTVHQWAGWHALLCRRGG